MKVESLVRRPTLPAAFLAACLAAWLGVGCQADSGTLTEARAAAIRDSVAAELERFRDLGAEADWDAVGDFYSESPEFRFYESGELRYRSAVDVRSALEAFGPGMRIETEYRDTEIVALAPGLAHVRALFESTLVGEGGFSVGFGGAVTMLWGHEAGGWRILGGHSSSPVPGGG